MRKKIYIYLMMSFLMIGYIGAQTVDDHLPKRVIEISGDSTKFIYEEYMGRSTLYNKTSRHDFYQLFPPPDYEYCAYTIDNDSNIEELLMPFISKSDVQQLLFVKLQVKAYPFRLVFFLNMDTGIIDDVLFKFSGRWDKKIFPIEKIEKIEKVVKAIKYNITKCPDPNWEARSKGKHIMIGHAVDLEQIRKSKEEQTTCK